MATNIGGITLGNLILGKSATTTNNVNVNQTLTFSQAISHTVQAVDQTITFTQTIGLQPVWGRTVSETLTFSQIVKTVIFEAMSSTLTFNQSISYDKAKVQSVSQSLSLSQTIADAVVHSPIIVQGLFPVHTIAPNGVFNRTVSPPLNFLQTIRGDYCKVVSNTLTFSQTLSYTKSKITQQTLELQQSYLYPTSFARSIHSNLIPSQVIGLTKQQSESVSQSLTLSQNIVEARVAFVTQSLALSQSIVAYASRSAKNTLTLNQAISYTHSNNVIVPQTLNLQQTIGTARTKTLKVHQGFGMNSFVGQHKQFYPSVVSNLVFTPNICFNRYTRLIGQNLSFSQTITAVHSINKSVTSQLTLNQSPQNNAAIHESVTSVLAFQSSRPVYLGMIDCQVVNVDNLQYALIPHNPGGAYRTKNRPHCVLQTTNTVVVVPTPDWNDTENYDGIFTIRRSMNGIPYTYVRTLELRKLRLPFTLDAAKGEELKQFLLDADSKIITLTTWKGDKWIVHLTSNPLEISRRGRWDKAYERVEITVEFEGYKVM